MSSGTERVYTRLPSLTGLRFVAALLVFGFHTFVEQIFAAPSASGVLAKVASQGGVGVSFFFILSGFVLTWSARSSDTVRGFWRRRFVKIFPNHLVTWAVALAILLAAAPQFLKPGAVVANLFLVQSWVPDLKYFFSVNMPSWSLSCELLFYLSFPLLLPLVRRIPVRALWWCAGGLVAAVWCIPVMATFIHGGGPMPPLSVTVAQFWVVYIFPLARGLEFALGMVMARVVSSGRWIPVRVWQAVLLTVAGYLAIPYLPFLFGQVAVTVGPLALLIPAVATADLNGTRSVWRSRTMVWLGNVSYAFYLVHQLVIRVGHFALGGGRWATPNAVAADLIFLAVAVGLAALLYYGVERPCMRAFAGRRAAQPVDAVAVGHVGPVGEDRPVPLVTDAVAVEGRYG
jgi:peptidoglycan/LPS O-acetylase OafA/YrhL